MKKFTFSRIKSISYALTGLQILVKSERNIWVHLMATVLVVAAGLLKGLSKVEWCFILIAIGLVWIAEAFNTAIEKLSNIVSLDRNPFMKQVKDISAAAVLIASLLALIIGCIVFIR